MQHFPLKTAYVFNHYLNLFSQTNYKKQTRILFSLYHSLALYAYSSDILQINSKKLLDLDLKKYSNCPSALCWISGYIGRRLEKHLDYLTGVRVIFKNLGIKKHLDYLTGLGLILLYIGLELFK